jgi:PAS domain S-box-containing protein
LVKEIEERKQIAEALFLKTSELENFFTVSLDLLCIADKSGNFIRVNKAWENILGFSISELEQRQFLEYVHPDDLSATIAVMTSINEENPVLNFINRYRTKDGNYRVIEWHSSATGNLIYAAARDITERKRAEEFENEMLELSPKLTGVTISEINDAINMALIRIGQFLEADRAFIFEFDISESLISNTYEWCKEGVPEELEQLQYIPSYSIPRTIEILQRHENVVIGSIKGLPESWKAELNLLEPQEIQSLILIPMLVDNAMIGFVGLDSGIDKKIYNQAEINILKVWSSMLASLINNQRKESLLELTRKNYETFFNTIDDFLFVLDVNGHIVHTNSTVNNRLGYSQEELAGQSVIMVRPTERRDEALKVMGELLSGETQVCSIPLMTKSGVQIPVETRVKGGFWNGQPIIFGVSKDISQIKLSEQKFSSAFQANSAMMAISDYETGRYIDVNNAFLETMGYSRDEIIGNTNTGLRLFDVPGLRDKILGDLNNHIPVRKLEIRVRTKDNQIKIGLLSADSIYIGEDRCLLTVTMDITERKNAEDELRKARLEADQANLAKSEFLSRMSHELRTPMNSILGFAQLLEMGQLSAGQKKGVSHIMRSGNHLLNLINEVLDIARIEAGRISLSLEPVKLSSIIPEMIDIIRPLANDKKVIVRVINMPEQQLFIKTDRQRLKQILLNLLNNAIKYNREGGQVFIKTEQILQKDELLPLVRISVTDTGLGISTDDLPKLFNPFERIGAERTQIEGTGLGLAVVKKLIDAMRGKLGVESTLGEGSTFWVEFPGCESQHDILEKSGKLNVLDANLTVKKGKILYVEDNASNIELVEDILSFQHEGIQLFTTIYGKSAVNMAITHKPDLILLDLNLPDIHGSEVLKLLLAEEETRKIPVVIISADAMPQQLEKLLKAGAKYYLTKPLDVPELLKVIDRYIPD